ncbi:MAG TPA: four-carbon acid sugar kinase family protein [Aliidongia sp.]|uniref:four-carbon acid sugar kinase family protein n=1 Tax=Aliidongia sp. TaxID=1914230 RepID=UPI002DDD2CF2|nr:four-carbon acid sugar kinase family protein [Aliidongia sp.]HEV2677330.1 four-carbon acid sugar kinase family protein [Aliidongia sp.]
MSATIRLLADDLTGALDTAAELVGLAGHRPLLAFWHDALPAALPANAALDSGTRELDAKAAVSVVAEMSAALSDATLAYKKIDSLLRGPTLAEAAACFRAGGWDRAVLAPAFPYQGRMTRGGWQHARDAFGNWSPIRGGDIVARLEAEGLPVHRGRIGQPLRPGISVFDAETDADLRHVAALGRAVPGSILWIGTGGLAQALAHAKPGEASGLLPQPLLGLFGSDQAVTAGQLVACGADWVRLPDGAAAQAAALTSMLQTKGRVLASLDLPTGLARAEAATRIAGEFGRLVREMPPPGTLFVAGGETLRGLCLALDAHGLELQGRLVPGLPRSILRGGPWDGVTVISKSGAFGSPTLLRDLVLGVLPSRAGTETERTS